MHADEISTYGRQTQGVRMMRLADDINVVSMALTSREDEEEQQPAAQPEEEQPAEQEE